MTWPNTTSVNIARSFLAHFLDADTSGPVYLTQTRPMAALDEFDSTLKEVVQAKRLSASKMTRLTEIALKSMESDTQLVSILYRTHKSLPIAAKVASLYVFDALARAARHQANKQGLTGDINSPQGNCATFLLKVEGVLEGLFQDMITVGSSEAKEKTKKILDIWVKGNTFPSTILSRLTDVVMGTEKVPEMKSSTSDPRVAHQPAPPAPTPPASARSPVLPPLDPQATLLALLAQAANAASLPSQTTTNMELGAAGLDAKQLAVLQQLALAQTASSPAPTQPALQAVPAQSGSAFPAPSSYREEPYNSLQKDRRFDRPLSQERVNAYDDQVNDRPSSRGGFRGGFRGRGRGDGRGRWDDRDRDRYRGDRERDEWNSSHRGRRSRSRSPPSKYGGRRDVRPYSPPRRPSFTSDRGRETSEPAGPDAVEKDEFGRDIRPKSPESDAAPPSTADSTQPPPPATLVPVPVDQPSTESSSALPSNHDRMSVPPLIAANTSSSTPSAPFVSSTVSPQPGMEKFNPATFDFTSPASWEALGKMWQVTHGYMPTTEQLMLFAMPPVQPAVTTPVIPTQNWPNTTGQVWRGAGRGRGFVRGRGGFGHGNPRNVQGEWAHNDMDQGTDAVVLGGGSSPERDIASMDDIQTGSSGNEGPGGRMQRIGDKWVFVRDSAGGVS
ncbi:hypothetical protein Hypma_008997 [Hypsizygus marmoreus]|uniref:CID domain-containing protein n=1 Tax=Hypsizygus marmoreus TaxID=39966 RepID=A0A369JTB4_HYPMA|nr:hypothetical protein Hypma_008997 [Hypsizygus marmoreus]